MADKGNYYRRKTKKYFEELGYATEYLERYFRIAKPGGKTLLLKSDIFGCDGISMNGEEIIFWNSIFGRGHLARAWEKMLSHPWPPHAKLWVIVWEKGAHGPEIETLEEEVKDA